MPISRLPRKNGRWGDLRPPSQSHSAVLVEAAGSITASVPEFWQQFPKAIVVEEDRLRFGLFPGQWDDVFELQGGERKTSTIWLRFEGSGPAATDRLSWTHHPARACLAHRVVCLIRRRFVPIPRGG